MEIRFRRNSVSWKLSAWCAPPHLAELGQNGGVSTVQRRFQEGNVVRSDVERRRLVHGARHARNGCFEILRRFRNANPGEKK